MNRKCGRSYGTCVWCDSDFRMEAWPVGLSGLTNDGAYLPVTGSRRYWPIAVLGEPEQNSALLSLAEIRRRLSTPFWPSAGR